MIGKLWLIIVSLLLAVSLSCSGTPELPPPPKIEKVLDNSIVVQGYRLSFTQDFLFRNKPSEDRILFGFTSPDGVSGVLERVDLSFQPSGQKLADFYAHTVMRPNGRIKVNEMEDSVLGQIWMFQGSQDDLDLLSFLIVDPAGFTFLHFKISRESTFTEQEGLRIFRTYRFEERPSLYLRQKPGSPLFVSENRRWRWVDDIQDGYLLGFQGDSADEDLFAGIWTVDPPEADKLRGEMQELYNPAENIWRIANIPREFRIYQGNSPSGQLMYYALHSLKNSVLCLQISGRGDDPGTLLTRQEIQEMLDTTLFFEGGLE